MVLIVTDRWDPDRGGRERYAADLARYLTATGQEVHVLCQSRSLKQALTVRLDADRSAKVLALSPVREATHYQLHGGLLASAFAAERDALESTARRALFGPALALNRRRQRLLAEEQQLLAGSTALMAFSGATGRELTERHGVPAARVLVARPGIDLRRFHPRGRSDAGDNAEHGTRVRGVTSRAKLLRLAFAGHNFALKGLRTAILAIARLQRAGVDATLRVAGRGSVGPYARLAAREGVADRVSFAGQLSQDQIADLFRGSDALVHPTFFDPFPRVVVEAMACGCPVVTTASCGATEILTDGVQGLVVRDPRDVAAVADAIGALAEPRRLSGMRTAAAALGATFDESSHFRQAAAWLSHQTITA